jgi:hypothetical protein
MTPKPRNELNRALKGSVRADGRVSKILKYDWRLVLIKIVYRKHCAINIEIQFNFILLEASC